MGWWGFLCSCFKASPSSDRQRTDNIARTGRVVPHTDRQHDPDVIVVASAGPHPSGDRTPDVPIVLLDIASSISSATDLRDPLNFTSEALIKLLDTAKSIDSLNEEWNTPLKRLRFHLDTIESQTVTLEEDSKIDKAALSPPLAPDPAIVRPLETYAKELNNIYRLLCDCKTADSSVVNNNAEGTPNDGIIARKISVMDDAFMKYTGALHDLAAKSIVQIKQQHQADHRSPDDANKSPEKPQKPPNAYGAQYGLCLPTTRVKTRAAIEEWADDKSGTMPIYLLLDFAGSGKSTVAKQMATDWTKQKRLFARFFFSRDTETTMSIDSFCSTVADAFAGAFADALAKRDDKSRARIEASMKAFKERKDLGLLSFDERFHGLVASPLEQLGLDAILIVDALDECDNKHGGRNELLNTIYSQQSPIARLRILATGRPERDIKEWAEKSGVKYTDFFQLEGDYNDVKVYIEDRLGHLSRIQDRVYRVIKGAEGVFIWARVACDLIRDTPNVDGLLEELEKKVSLDYLYEVALGQSIPNTEQPQQAFTTVLQMILASREPLSIAQLEMLSPEPGVVEYIVTRLGAVLLYKDRDDPIRLLHATFREFLTTQSKAGVYFIQPERGHQTLALGCLRFLSDRSSLDDSALRELDTVSKREDISLLIKCLLTLYSGLIFTRHSHGCITVKCRTENWL